MEEEDLVEEAELAEEHTPVHRLKKGWSRLPAVGKAGIAIFIILIIIGAATLSAPGKALFKEKYHLVHFDAARAYRDHLFYEALGPRMTGSDAEMEGAEYMAAQMTAAGLSNVHIEEFEYFLFSIDRAEVSMVPYGVGGFIPKPGGAITTFEKDKDFVVQAFSGSHSWNNFMDDMVLHDMGNASSDEDWQDAEGKCGVMWNDQWTPGNTQIYQKGRDHDLACLIVHNKYNSPNVGYIPMFKGVYIPKDEEYTTTMPFFIMSKAMGDEVMAMAKNGSKMRINFDVPHKNIMIRVPVGEVLGREKSDKFVLLGAHSDTVHNGPGAVDNTAGTVTVLEMARNMAKERPKRTIRFAGFGGEEEGLLGSAAYAEAHKEEIQENMIFYENSDMTNIDLKRGVGGWIGSNDNASVEHYKAIHKLVVQHDSRFEKYEMSIAYDPMWSGSDQAIFRGMNKNVCFAAGSGSWEYHTYLDNINHINPESEALFGEILGTYAYYLAENDGSGTTGF